MSDLETRLANRLQLHKTGTLRFPEWQYRMTQLRGVGSVHNEFVHLIPGPNQANTTVEMHAMLSARTEVLSARKFVAKEYPGLSERAQTNLPEGALAWILFPEAFTIRDYARDRVQFLREEIQRLKTHGGNRPQRVACFDPESDLPEWTRRASAIEALIPTLRQQAIDFTTNVLKQMHADDRARAEPYVRAALNEKTNGKEVGRGQPFAFYERERASEMMGIEWPWRAPERFIGFAERSIHKSRQEGKTAAEIEASVSMRMPVDEHAIERMAEARVQDQGNVTMQQAVLLTCLNGLSTICSNAHALEAEDQRRKEFRKGQIDWANGVFAAETPKYRSDATTRPELNVPELMAKVSKEMNTSPMHLSAIDTLRDLMRNGNAYCHKARAAVAGGGVDAMDALLNPGVSMQRVMLLEHISLAETTFSAVEYAIGDTCIALASEAAKVSQLGEWFSTFRRRFEACAQTPNSAKPKATAYIEPQPKADAPEAEFRLDGDMWRVSFAGVSGTYRNLKGMGYLQHILKFPNPARPLEATDLMGLATPDEREAAAPQYAIGKEQRLELREEYQRLTRQKEQAERDNDNVMLEEASKALSDLASYAAKDRALSDKGENLQPASDSEKARKAVLARLRTVNEKLGDGNPPMKELVSHLKAAIRAEGTGFAYRPGPNAPEWAF